MKAAKAQHRPLRSTSPTRRSASICSTAPTRRSRARSATRLLKALGARASSSSRRSAVKADPAAARRRSRGDGLFGGARAIWIEPAGDEIADGRRGAARSAGVREPGGRDRRRAAQDLGAAQARRRLIRAALAHRVLRARRPRRRADGRSTSAAASGCGSRPTSPRGSPTPPATTRRSPRRSSQKLALYLGRRRRSARGARPRHARRCSAPTRPRATCCGLAIWRWRDGWMRLLDELARLPPGGNEAIPVVRALQRRLLMLAPLRARVERGETRRCRHDVTGQGFVLEG